MTHTAIKELGNLAEFELDVSLHILVHGGALVAAPLEAAATNAGFCVNQSCGNGLCGNDYCIGTGNFNAVCLHST